jgi:hypothetical protein
MTQLTSNAPSAGGIMWEFFMNLPLDDRNLSLVSQWLLDVLICNWLGTYVGQSCVWYSSPIWALIIDIQGMKACQYFEVKVRL